VLQQSLFLATSLREGAIERDTTINLRLTLDCCTTKCELKLWLKANPDSHATKHQENKLKHFLNKKIILWETVKAQHMCVFGKVDALSFWKKYRPRALIVDKISVATLLEGFCGLVGQSLPPIQLRTDHLAQVIVFPLSHTLNTDITLAELFQAFKKL
jgi:hypothetical protein